MKVPEDAHMDTGPSREAVVAELSRDPPVEARLGLRICRATLVLACIALLVKALGFAEKVLVAYYFGASREVDAYFVAVSAPMLFFLLMRELVEAPFLPLFIQSLRQGQEPRGWRLITAVGLAILIVSSTFSLFVEIAPAWVGRLLAPGFDDATRDSTARLLRVLSPASVFLSLSALTYITLNGYHRFGLASAGDLAWKLGPILAGSLLFGTLGIHALAVGYLLGSAARLVVHLGGLAPMLPLLKRPLRSDRGDLGQFGALLLPLLFGAVLAQFSEVADNYFSSLLGEGGVSARTYAKKLRDLPLEVLPSTLSIVLLPHFAALHSDGHRDLLQSVLAGAVKSLAVCFALVGVLLFALAEPTVSLALEWGAFDADARVVTAATLRLYALGMVSFAVEGPLVNFYFAVKDTRTPVLAGVLHVLLNIALCAALIRPLGVAGIALALTLSKTTKVLVLGFLLHRGKHALPLAAITRVGLLLLGAAAVSLLGVQAWLGGSTVDLADVGVFGKLQHLLVGALVGTLLFLGTLLLLGRAERSTALAGLHRLRRRGRTT